MWPFAVYPEKSPPQVDGKSYDYVIVGGGTAGCVLASRLSEDPTVSVLVIEKGHFKDNLVSRIPLLSQNIFMGDPLQVQSTRWSEPIAGANNRKNRLWAAEGIGGATRINAMLWTRSSPGDFNAWAGLGLKDWAWDEVEPYFRRAENAMAFLKPSSDGRHGAVRGQRRIWPFEWIPFVRKAAENLGLPIEKNYNDPTAPAMGHFDLDTTINDRGERISAFKAFLGKEVLTERRGRLTVCTGAIASRLELDGATGIASGVYIRSSRAADGSSGESFFVKARREIIVCSGTMCTPQLLMLSGIGPESSGKSLGIPLIKELPAVGARLADHYSFPIMLELPRRETLHILETLYWGLWHMLLWIFFGRGFMSMSSTAHSIFLRTTAVDEQSMRVKRAEDDGADNLDASQPRNIPDVEIIVIPLNTLQRSVPGRTLFSFFPLLVQPRGAGRIELASADPLAHPRITHPMFADRQDVVAARVAARFTMRLAEEFQNSGYPYPAPLVFAPGNNLDLLEKWERSDQSAQPARPMALTSEGIKKSSLTEADTNVQLKQQKTWRNVTDSEIDDYVRRVSHTSLHFSCTCPISNDEKTGVVDQQLRVHGFKNLRIADASVFPKVPSAHTMAPTLMVAERCAEFIKRTWEGTEA